MLSISQEAYRRKRFHYFLLFQLSICLNWRSWATATLGGIPSFYDVGGNRQLFAWHFDPEEAAYSNDGVASSVILWLSGGPGCSSLLALFGENGPYTIEPRSLRTPEAVPNPYSWIKSGATVIWLDQPVGTGFSYGGVPRHDTEEGVAEDVWSFLVSWFKRFPEYEGRSLEIFGESYAGHYVPAVGRKILHKNQDNANYYLNLTGIAIGNGFTDPAVQYKYYAPFAKEHDLVPPAELKMMDQTLKLCEPLVDGCNSKDDDIIAWTECFNAYLVCNMGLIYPVELSGVNPYDIRDQCEVQPLCYDFSPIDDFLARPEVRDELGIPEDHTWSECNTVVDLAMVYGGDWTKNFRKDVEEILDDKSSGNPIEVLIYAGEYDFVCNWMGNLAWTENLSWEGSEGYAAAKEQSWVTATQKVAGTFKSYSNLTFLKVFDAGHLVPFDQPENSLDMVKQHLNRSFSQTNESQMDIFLKDVPKFKKKE